MRTFGLILAAAAVAAVNGAGIFVSSHTTWTQLCLRFEASSTRTPRRSWQWTPPRNVNGYLPSFSSFFLFWLLRTSFALWSLCSTMMQATLSSTQVMEPPSSCKSKSSGRPGYPQGTVVQLSHPHKIISTIKLRKALLFVKAFLNYRHVITLLRVRSDTPAS